MGITYTEGNPAPGSRNDIVRLGFVDATSQFVGPSWAAYFGTGSSGPPTSPGPGLGQPARSQPGR